MGRALLIVDDSSSMRRIIRRTVQVSGFKFDTIYEAASAEAGFRELSSNAVDVVLCDVNMAGISGVEMVRRVREELPSCEKTRIIMVTTEGSSSFVSEAMAAGADGCIKKPFTAEQFAGKLTSML